MSNEKDILVFVGPSGAGKSSLIEYAKNEIWFLSSLDKFSVVQAVTDTNRTPRKGEIDGVNYNFRKKENFFDVEKIEYANYSGNFYGLSKDEINNKLSSNDVVLVALEKQGALKLKEIYGDIVKIVYVYLTPETMESRMRSRGDKEEDIIKRMSNAIKQKEFDNIHLADYVLINEDGRFEENCLLLKTIIKSLVAKRNTFKKECAITTI